VNAAEAFIRKEIETRGPLPFSRFMELALYHPEHGYYSTVSPLQDYYTSVDVHPLFAKILAGRKCLSRTEILFHFLLQMKK
jgi:SAM-dependent MidA family methyltransferase